MRISLIMMAGKLPKNAMNLKQVKRVSDKVLVQVCTVFYSILFFCSQFMMHKEVLKLYRNFMRSIKQIPNKKDRETMRDWVRSDFKKLKDVTDEVSFF